MIPEGREADLMRVRFGVILAVLCAGLPMPFACHHALRNGGAREVPCVDWVVELTGSGLGKPISFPYEQLAQMDAVRLDDVLMLQTHGPDKMTSWRGPSLDGLLRAAELRPGPMKVSIQAADGYTMTCPLEDLESAILGLQDGEGRWLADSDNTRPIRLVPPKKPGDYWIVNPARIIVTPAADAGSP